MKLHKKWLVVALAAAGGLMTTNLVQAQSYTISDFNNFNLSVTYANWDADGSQTINGGSGYTPTLTSGATSFTVDAQGYGSGAYDFVTPINAAGANMYSFTFSINNTQPSEWFGPIFDLSDTTHQVQYANFNNYAGPGTYTVTGSLGDLDVSQITAMNLEINPAANGGVYNVSFDNLTIMAAPTPEPSTMALLASGAFGILVARRQLKVR